MFRNYKRESEAKIANLSHEIEDYRKRVNDSMGVQTQKIAEYENKLLVLSQEIERLNYVLKEHSYEMELLQKK